MVSLKAMPTHMYLQFRWILVEITTESLPYRLEESLIITTTWSQSKLDASRLISHLAPQPSPLLSMKPTMMATNAWPLIFRVALVDCTVTANSLCTKFYIATPSASVEGTPKAPQYPLLSAEASSSNAIGRSTISIATRTLVRTSEPGSLACRLGPCIAFLECKGCPNFTRCVVRLEFWNVNDGNQARKEIGTRPGPTALRYD